MCLAGAAPTYQPPPKREPEVGPESPQDKVNNMDVENINDRSRQDEFRNKNKGDTASKQSGRGSQSSKTDKAY